MGPPPLSSPLAGMTLSGSGPCSSPPLDGSHSHSTSVSCELPEISAPSIPANHDPFLSSVNRLMLPSISLDTHGGSQLKTESNVHPLDVSSHHHADLPPLGRSPEALSMRMDSFAPLMSFSPTSARSRSSRTASTSRPYILLTTPRTRHIRMRRTFPSCKRRTSTSIHSRWLPPGATPSSTTPPQLAVPSPISAAVRDCKVARCPASCSTP